MLKVAFGQPKFSSAHHWFLHAMVFWGFCLIIFGSIEMVIDGLFGLEKSLSVLGWFHDFIMAAGDIFAPIIAIAIVVFLIRRVFLHIKRFEGIEMKKISHIDANIALTLILLLMISLMGMNTAYLSWCHSLERDSWSLSGKPAPYRSVFLLPVEVIYTYYESLVVTHSAHFSFCQHTPLLQALSCVHATLTYFCRGWNHWASYPAWRALPARLSLCWIRTLPLPNLLPTHQSKDLA